MDVPVTDPMSSTAATVFRPADTVAATARTAMLTVAATACGSPTMNDGRPAARRLPKAAAATPALNLVNLAVSRAGRSAPALVGTDNTQIAMPAKPFTLPQQAPTTPPTQPPKT